MRWYDSREGFERIDRLGAEGEDFLFILSFDRERIFAEPLEALPENLYYRIEEECRLPRPLPARPDSPALTSLRPLPYPRYKEAFDRVIEAIRRGETYLLNLTFPTPIESGWSLEEIFAHAEAPYKLALSGEFCCFSPERFLSIDAEIVRTFPMKGTIDASLPEAAERILSDPKETAEHVMITDLMRNDINRIATEVRVERFRYLDRIRAGEKELLQVSSQIRGTLPRDWRSRLGSLLRAPAGSVTGTPKCSTVELIRSIEGYERGFYTGVFGICRGERLRSAVMIRYIEKDKEGNYLYKSGGGITLMSDPESEYRELIDKVYIPLP